MKAGQIFRSFVAKNGKTVTLRAARWDDLPALLEFANTLVGEREEDKDLGILLDRQNDMESEAEWLAAKLVQMESGRAITVVSEVEGKLVGNSGVERGRFADEFHHGKLGIAIAKEYRGIGIGYEMVVTLLDESRKAGIKTMELEVFANNPRAIHLYEKSGFARVGLLSKKIFRNNRHIDVIIMAIDLDDRKNLA